jgi:protein-disulfide isomerase
MASLISLLSRRSFFWTALGGAVGFSLPAFAEKAVSGKVSVDELMTIGALPDLMQGAADAPVTVVEYASMTCSHCAAFHRDVFPLLKKNYIDTGKVKFVLREFPLDPLATAAFMLARALGDKRDAAVDLLFALQKSWVMTDTPRDSLEKVLKQTGMSAETFEATLKNDKLRDGVVAVHDRAVEKFGVNSTPTFFINGDKYSGEMTIADLDAIIAAKSKK